MNKKGLVLKTLLVIVFTLIVFVPMILFVSKACTRLSGQAEDKFVDLGKLIEEFKDSEEGKKEDFLLILDDKTAIVGFSENNKKVRACQGELCVDWKVPNRVECESGGCICLIKGLGGVEGGEVKYTSSICRELEGIAFEVPYYIQKTEGTKVETKYYYEGGFVLGRGIVSPGLNIYRVSEKFHFENRRNLIFLMKKEGTVQVCWEESCKSSSETVKSKWDILPGPGV